MLNKSIKSLSFIGLSILLIQVAVCTGTNAIVYADTNDSKEEVVSEVNEMDSPELFESVKEDSDENLKEETIMADGAEISTLTDENNDVRATEIVDSITNETIAITNTGDNVIVEKTTIDGNGEQQTTQEIFPVIKTDMNDNLLQNRLVYDAWSYTGLALGRNFFQVVAGMAISKITAAFAAAFGISGAAASFAVTYMGVKSGMSAANLAKSLDSNGNGWIALYKRWVRNYKGGPGVGTQHRTY